jgi:hypothetical protein
MSELKEQLHQLSRVYLDTNIRDIEAAIADRREAIAGETKSSMGDKYETTREMLQQDINMNIERLSKTKAELTVLNTIDPYTHGNIITTGSLVYTSKGNFYIAVSAGHFIIDGMKYYIVSSSSPIAICMKGKSQGDTFDMNGRLHIIEKVL